MGKEEILALKKELLEIYPTHEAEEILKMIIKDWKLEEGDLEDYRKEKEKIEELYEEGLWHDKNSK